MKNVYVNNEASINRIRLLAEWAYSQNCKRPDADFDVVRFVEIELPAIVPGIYVHIETDDVMGSRRAFVSEKPLGLVVSESVYDAASQGCLFSSEVILHEVGHILLHHRYATLGLNDAHGVYRPQIRNMAVVDGAEWQATTFAMCLLYPLQRLESVKSMDEILEIYDSTPKQASRILRHVDKMIVGRRKAASTVDRKWLRSIVNTLPKAPEAKGV